ncbi:MAG: PAS domain S-box protein, partial [Candidatus Dojkabacteria bacterium]
MFESAQDGILLLDYQTGKVIDVNPYLVKLLGYSREDFLGEYIWKFGSFKNSEAVEKNFRTVKRKGYIRFEDIPLETKDGVVIDVEFVANTYKVGDKEVVQCDIRNINERKKIENRLKISELRYRRLFETAQDGVLLLDYKTGEIDDVNPYLISLLGYTKKDFLKKHLWEVGVFKDTAASKENFRALQSRKYVRFEDLPLQTKDGAKINVEFVANAYDVGEKTVIQCNIRDITDRKRSELKLKLSEKRYRRLFETAQDGIILLDFDTGMILDVNTFLIKMLDYSKSDFLKKHIWEVGIFKDIAASKENFKTLQVKRYVRFEDLPLETKSGKKIDVEFVANAYEGAENTIIQCNIRNISDRKIIEKTILEQKDRYEAMIASLGVGIYAVDKENKFILVNKKAEELLGFSAKQLISKKMGPSDTMLIDEEGKIIPKEKHPTFLALSTKENFSTNKYSLFKKDHAPIPIDLTVTPLILNGENIGAVDVMRDVTQEKLIDKSKTELISLASHQLRTPLTALSWLSEILMNGGDGVLNSTQQGHVEDMYKASKRMIT